VAYIKFFKVFRVYLVMFAILILVANPESVISSAHKGMLVCFSKIIPSLFPFMVLSGLFVSSLTSDSFARLGKVTYRLFGVRAAANAAFIPGLVCGYPIGAKCTCELYLSGRISKSEAESLLAFSNNSGPLFVIGAVGVGMLGSAKVGILLYIIQIICALSAAVVMRFFTSYPIKVYQKGKTVSKDFAACVCDSVINVLGVCGFVVFFSVVNSIIEPLISIFPDWTQMWIKCIPEITNGIGSIASQNKITPLNLAAISFALGWSGLSVHMQVKSVIAKSDISMKKYYITRLVIGCASAIITYLVSKDIDFISLTLLQNRNLIFIASFFTVVTIGFLQTKKEGKFPL